MVKLSKVKVLFYIIIWLRSKVSALQLKPKAGKENIVLFQYSNSVCELLVLNH